jgi:DNA-binding CsgD family transcriptional regulator
MSPIVLGRSLFINKLFTDEQPEKPNYGELACLSLAKEGLDMLEISNLTGYTVNTVKSNLKNARIKLKSKKTIDAVITALNMRWIS